MPLIKPPVLPPWAEAGDKIQPSNAELQAGWPLSNTPPSRQRMNWVKNYLMNGVRYFSRRGIPDYDAAETYMIGDRVLAANGKTYRAIADNVTNKEPSANAAEWELWGFSKSDLAAAGLFSTAGHVENSTKPATTAFVQTRARAFRTSGGIGINVPTFLTWAQAGLWFEIQADVEVTLPPINTGYDGATFHFRVTNPCTLKFSGTDALSTGVTSRRLYANEYIELVRNANGWYIISNGADDSFARFITRESLGNARGWRSFNAGAITLTSADLGKVINNYGATTGTVTLPAVADVPAGSGFMFSSNPNGAGIQINCVGGNQIVNGNGAGAASHYLAGDGESMFLYSTGSGTQWYAMFADYARKYNVGNLAGSAAVSAASTLTSAHAGKYIWLAGAGNYTTTLPAANAVREGTVLEFFATATGCTIARNGTNSIYVKDSTVTSLTLGNGDTLRLVSNGADSWFAIGGSAQLGSSAAFGSSRSSQGYTKLPNGLIIQWLSGTFGVTGTAQVIDTAFPIAFPNALLSVTVGNFENANNNDAPVQYRSNGTTLSTMRVYCYSTIGGSTAFSAIAIGY